MNDYTRRVRELELENANLRGQVEALEKLQRPTRMATIVDYYPTVYRTTGCAPPVAMLDGATCQASTLGAGAPLPLSWSLPLLGDAPMPRPTTCEVTFGPGILPSGVTSAR